MRKMIQNLINRNKRNATETIITLGVRCFICQLPPEKRALIDKSLTEESVSLRTIADGLNISKASVWRHAKNHLVPEVKKQLVAAVASQPEVLDSTRTLEDLHSLNAKAEVTVLYRKAKGLLETAVGAKDFQATRGFLSEGRQCLELMGRFDHAFLESRAPEVDCARPPMVLFVLPTQPDGKHYLNGAPVIEAGPPQVLDPRGQQ
jgi:hypothetical protein